MIKGGDLTPACASNWVDTMPGTNEVGTGSNAYIGQIFTPSVDISPASVSLYLARDDDGSTSVHSITMKIYSVSNGLPKSVLYNSSTTYAQNGLPLSASLRAFNFSGVTLSAGVQYAFVLVPDVVSSTYYYRVGTTSSYPGGNYVRYDGSIWSSYSTQSIIFVMQEASPSATVIWTAVTSTEALNIMAVVADQDEKTGTITWYVSDDGTNWIETDLDTMTATNFDATSVYLKCVLTGDATVSAVAYGGY
jgi:hypothetical protein